MDFTGHLSKIKKSLYVLDNFLSENECDELIYFAQSTPQIFRDRSKFRPNYGVKGELGTYMSCGIIREYYPDIWNKFAVNKLINKFPVSEIQLNKYEKGEHMPPHRDFYSTITG